MMKQAESSISDEFQVLHNERNALLSSKEEKLQPRENPFSRKLVFFVAFVIVGGIAIVLGPTRNEFLNDDASNTLYPCNDGKYSKRTLKLAYELPFASLFKDNKHQIKYEASDVILLNGDIYSVCDSSWSISKFQLTPFASDNIQLGDPSTSHTNEEDDTDDDESGYEAMIHDDNTLYVIRESLFHKSRQKYHAVIEELKLTNKDYELVEQCRCEFEFEGDSKGFEGAVSVHDLNDNLVILGLCEGNHCSEIRKNDKGNGRIVLMQKIKNTGGNCEWKTLRTMNIPSSANFKDYSAITLNSQTGRVAISSQENSQIWLGWLEGGRPTADENGHTSLLWDIDSMEFRADDYKVYDFPKNNQCETIYCNIEGIHWMNDEMLVAVSDKMKSKGKQDFRCFEKDQSVHVFALPK